MTGQHAVIDRMQALIDLWEQSGDRRADFLTCYQLMTSNMLSAVEAGEFHDATWVDALLHHFAEYYFMALNDYEAASEGTPAAWRLAFDATRQDGMVLQNLLLGINAHITYDLVLALSDMLAPEWESLSQERRQKRYEDHRHVNEIIGRTVDSVQAQVVAPDLPVMRAVDSVLGPLDEWLASRMIARWREEVWSEAAQVLDSLDRDERESLLAQVEAESVRRAQAILSGRNPMALV